MSAPAAKLRDWPEWFERAGYWALPPLFAIWYYWVGVKTWFVADDFAWLRHTTEFSNFHEFLLALFKPMAQGTIRPWSERLFFIVFYRIFGLNPLPFHIWIALTQCANILLLLAIARRLTGSRLAGFAAALAWIVNSSQPMMMGWAAAYNQPLCALFILGAFYLLLRYFETGRRGYWILQWVVFLLGFGALELNVVYPALAMGYSFCRARKHFRRTIPLVAPSIVFAIGHRMATGITSSVYAMHFGLPMLQTLWTYWTWTLGAAYLATIIRLPEWEVWAATLAVSAGLVGVAAWRAAKRDYLPLYLLFWYVVLLGPVLPLSDHLTEYYPFLPSAGLAMLGGYGIALAWSRSREAKAAAVVLAAIYFGFSVPTSRRSSRWQYERGRDVRKVVLGVQRARELHPNQIILLDGVDDMLFWRGIIDRPFDLMGAYNVYLTPDCVKQIVPRPALGDVSDFVIPPGPAFHALMRDEAVVYSTRPERLRNITSIYTRAVPAEWESMIPERIDPGDPAEVYLLGPGWYKVEGNHRWMGRRASVRIAGPRSAGSRLHVNAIPAPNATTVILTIDGVRLPGRALTPGQDIEVEVEAPASAVGKPEVNVEIELDQTFHAPDDPRELGAAFGVIEFR